MNANTLSLLTTSRLKAARACQRYHHLRYELGYRAVVEEDVLRFGTLVHKGLEAWWLAKKDGPAERALELAIAAVQDEADPFDRVRAEVVLTGYDARWSAEPYEVVGVEIEFATELRNPQTGAASRTWRLGGKIDAIVRDTRDGRVLLVEHKTSSEDITPGSTYWSRLRMDGQVSIYFAGARQALGIDVAGCLYDVLLKPAQRPGNVPLVDEKGVKIVVDKDGERVRTKDGKKWRQTADTELGFVLQTRPETPEEFRARLVEAMAGEPDRFFARGEVVRLEAELEEALFDIWQTAQQIREANNAGRNPRNPDSCVRYGKTCEFFDICTGAASLEDRSRFARNTNVHPELSAPAEQAAHQ
jgi:hypothetical protein